MKTTLKYKISNKDFIEYKQKATARRMTNEMLKRGEITRASHCERCSIQYKTVAHHTDYGEPSKIVWLCNACHGAAHRKYSDLNPLSIKQTTLARAWHPRDYVQVSFNIPVENFIAMKKLAKDTGKTFSKLLRGCVLEKYPVHNDQLEFNFGENDNENNAKISERICVLEQIKTSLHESNRRKILSIR